MSHFLCLEMTVSAKSLGEYVRSQTFVTVQGPSSVSNFGWTLT